MPKKALGRSLGELLPERAGLISRDSISLHKSKDPTDLGPGLRALVLNKNGAAPQHGRMTPEVRRGGGATVLKVSLVLADVVLVAVTLLWRRQAQGRMGGWEALACIISITFAAWLGCLTAWVHFRGD